MKKKTILVVQGGVSSEREISLKTGKACTKALKELKYKIISFDPANKNLSKIKQYVKKVDLIFNALHGRDGEDGIAQSYFEYFKIPYTHSGIISSMNAMDKIISKKIFKKNNLLTANYISLNSVNYKIYLGKKELRNLNFNYPIIVKPSNEGSSIGVEICKNFNQLKKSVVKLIKNYKSLIVEKYIAGQEIQVAVINGKALGAIAEKTHKVLNCKGVTRSDFKFFNNKFYLLEINTQPGMTDLSLVPEIAKYAGVTFKELVKKIIDDAPINR